ncbi:hypothetical protein BBP40_003251 [Aspergillus hancockii]|nr:hypothetical protein BBP40_003251 [Aspergillus hancockii]
MSRKIILDHLAYVIYEHRDLEKFRKFAQDFGFELAGEVDGSLYLTGYGIDHYSYVATQAPATNPKGFIGAGFVAKSEKDFLLACEYEGVKIKKADGLPGGGEVAILKDPNGYELHVIWGQRPKDAPARPISACIDGNYPMNGAVEKKRKGQFVRLIPGPAKVHKLGHFGYITGNYENTCAWGESTATKVHHSSFEVEDLDTQFMGHKWLETQEYRLVWGIGRHFHGSQVFDYWYDTSGFIMEHYADGDMVNNDAEVTRAAAGNMAVWGPPVPAIWGGSQTST